MINFENTKSAFAHQSDWELKKAYFLFSVIKSAYLVKIGSVLLKFSFFLKLPIKRMVKRTIFRQFCGGENIKDCKDKINHLSQFGIGTILDYSVEGKENDKDFERTKKEIIQTILFSANNSKCPFSVFKVTGLGRSSLIQKASQGVVKLNKSESEELKNITVRIDEICKKIFRSKLSN